MFTYFDNFKKVFSHLNFTFLSTLPVSQPLKSCAPRALIKILGVAGKDSTRDLDREIIEENLVC